MVKYIARVKLLFVAGVPASWTKGKCLLDLLKVTPTSEVHRQFIRYKKVTSLPLSTDTRVGEGTNPILEVDKLDRTRVRGLFRNRSAIGQLGFM